MNPKIFINAGHYLKDPGYVCDCQSSHRKEAEETMKIRDALKTLLPDAVYVPDEYSLRETINWINVHLPDKNDLAIDIHLNSNINPSIGGTEAYYVLSPRMAQIFSQEISKTLKITDRGPKHDSFSYVRSLFFLRAINCQSVLVECCYMTNEEDMKVFDPIKAAVGIKNAIDIIYPKTIEQQLTILQRLIEALREKIYKLIKKT